MTLSILHHMRRSADQWRYGSPLYNWSLSGTAPDHLIVKPVDQWPGDAEAGQWLCQGAFVLEDDQLELHRPEWEPEGVSERWLEHMHGFTWLRDLRAMGGEQARQQARAMIAHWIAHYPGWHKLAWRPDIAGERVAMWIALYECFGPVADEDFHDAFYPSLFKQARHLAKSLPGALSGVGLLKGWKGLLYAGLAFAGRESWIEQALDGMEKEIERQVLGDGMHVSRSPAHLLSALQILLDVRTALAAGGYPLPEAVQHAIDRMGPALRFFRHADKHLAIFNGSQEGHERFIDCVLGQTGLRGKPLSNLPGAGYERLSLGRTTVIFDCGKPPAAPYDRDAHAAPLAFEVSYGKERIFNACGTHPTLPEWHETLRATAAHCALTIDQRNAYEIRADGHFARKAKNVVSLREDTQNSCLAEGSHDGYLPISGIIHRRRLYLTDKGHDLRGEDLLTCTTGLARPHEVAVRFHIHPRVLVSLIRDGEEALLRLPSGIGWRFHQAGGHLCLEDSVALHQGTRTRKTKQLVIYGQITEDQYKIKWALQREG